jgi:hypothetical protein
VNPDPHRYFLNVMDENPKCQIFTGKNRVFIRLLGAVTIRMAESIAGISRLPRFELSLRLDTDKSDEFD